MQCALALCRSTKIYKSSFFAICLSLQYHRYGEKPSRIMPAGSRDVEISQQQIRAAVFHQIHGRWQINYLVRPMPCIGVREFPGLSESLHASTINLPWTQLPGIE